MSKSLTTFSYTSDLFAKFENAVGGVNPFLKLNGWNKVSDTSNTVNLIQIAEDGKSVLFLSPSTLVSNSNTFLIEERDGFDVNYTSSDKFTIKKLNIKINEEVARYVRLLSVSVNTFGDVWRDFILTKLSNSYYSAELESTVDVTTSAIERFKIVLDVVPPLKGQVVLEDDTVEETGGFEFVQLFTDLESLLFASIQYSGNYVVVDDVADNINRLEDDTKYIVSVQEYNRLITIFEEDDADADGNTGDYDYDNQYSTISIDEVKYSTFKKTVGGVKKHYSLRRYILGDGELINVRIKGDINEVGNEDGILIPKLNIKSGEFVSYRAHGDAEETVYHFKLYVYDSEKSKLPNQNTNVVNVYSGPDGTDSTDSLVVSYSHPLDAPPS